MNRPFDFLFLISKGRKEENMTLTREPWFMSWIIVTGKGWELKPDAPAKVKKAFKKYLKMISMEIHVERRR